MIYVLEDDPSIRGLEVYALEAAGLETRAFDTAESFLAAACEAPPALVVLDIMLPGGMDGLETMKRLRESVPGVSVIIASAKGDEFDRVKGLDLGADDYLAKPFGMLEMVSRVKAVLRRSGHVGAEILSSGDVVLDRAGHSVSVAGAPVELTRKEFALLELLMSSPGRVFTRENLLERIWGAEAGMETRTVDMHVAGVRAKCARPELVETVRGVGYKFPGTCR